MQIDDLTSDRGVLLALGRRLARARQQKRLSQDVLAEEAGVGVATLRRIEAGQGCQLESWIRVMRALGRISAIDDMLPDELRSPMAEVMRERELKRLPRRRGNSARWGDEEDAV